MIGMAVEGVSAATAIAVREGHMAKKTGKAANTQAMRPSDEGAVPAREAEKDVLSEEEARALLEGRDRTHAEALGRQWAVVLGANPAQVMPQVVAQVLAEGGTRAAWQWMIGEQEHVVMAWPSDQPVRAAVVMRTQERGGQFKPCDAFPLLEGLPNDLTVAGTHPWASGSGANVAVTMMEGKNPMWFYDPFYLRDKNDLTPGVTHTFTLAGLALGIRKALLDDVTITQGPEYDAHALRWLRDHPGKTRLDVPPCKVPLNGRHMIMPGRVFGEYQMRATIEEVQDVQLEKMPLKLLRLCFPFHDRPPLSLPVYASAMVLGEYQPRAGEDADLYVWLQGRVIDFDPQEEA